jgi:hypothetical protein
MRLDQQRAAYHVAPLAGQAAFAVPVLLKTGTATMEAPGAGNLIVFDSCDFGGWRTIRSSLFDGSDDGQGNGVTRTLLDCPQG